MKSSCLSIRSIYSSIIIIAATQAVCSMYITRIRFYLLPSGGLAESSLQQVQVRGIEVGAVQPVRRVQFPGSISVSTGGY